MSYRALAIPDVRRSERLVSSQARAAGHDFHLISLQNLRHDRCHGSAIADARDLVLTESAEKDAALRRSFRAHFPTMDIAELSFDAIKHEVSKGQWRSLLQTWQGKIAEYNMICLLRRDCRRRRCRGR